jgi:hypothetical protein
MNAFKSCFVVLALTPLVSKVAEAKVGAGSWLIATCNATDPLWDVREFPASQRIKITARTNASGKVVAIQGIVETDGHYMKDSEFEYIHSWTIRFDARVQSITRRQEDFNYVIDIKFAPSAKAAITTEGSTSNESLPSLRLMANDDESWVETDIRYSPDSVTTLRSIDIDCTYNNLALLQ